MHYQIAYRTLSAAEAEAEYQTWRAAAYGKVYVAVRRGTVWRVMEAS